MANCSGHGAPYDLDGRALCMCDAAWSGAADMYDQVSTSPTGAAASTVRIREAQTAYNMGRVTHGQTGV